MIHRPTALAAALAVALAGCATSGATPAPSRDTELVVYAAASLTRPLADVRTAYEAANPGTSIVVSTDSSAALATKIEQGAPADVFLSADLANARRLADEGLATGAPVEFATNALTVIVPAGNPAGLASPADLARPGLKVIAAGDAVPITGYAQQLVANLAREPGYPSDFAARYAANVVSREDNVSGIVTKVALGEGDAGIVYVTDARSSDEVTAIEVPPTANVEAVYAGVAIGSSPDPEAATAFLAWLAGPDGQAALAPFGFSGPG